MAKRQKDKNKGRKAKSEEEKNTSIINELRISFATNICTKYMK